MDLALLDLGMGRPGEAFDRLNAMIGAGLGEGHQMVKTFAAADLVEVAVRSGRDEQAADVAAMLRAWATNMEAGLGVGTRRPVRRIARPVRLRQPLRAGHCATRPKRQTVRRCPHRTAVRGIAGEATQPVQTRTHLRAAHEVFESLGAAPWADRARAELLATGETARKRDPSTLSQLTPQELQIVRLVGAGGTNERSQPSCS